MAKNTQPDKNESAVLTEDEAKVEALLGPAPTADMPVPPDPKSKSKSDPKPEPADPSPEDEEKERLLVIPPSDKSQTPEKAAAQAAGDQAMPQAGTTVKPTDPEALKEQAKNTKKENIFKRWWHNRKARRLTILAFLLILFGLAIYPNSRYFMLNTAGVRSSASLSVLDNSTQLPLKNVEVSLAGQTAKTDDEGMVKLEHIKLGSTQLVIQKRAFAEVTKSVTVGWGSNPLGSFQVQPTGSQYALLIKDWLNDKSITEASAHSGDADAVVDKNGKILLTIDTDTAQRDSIPVVIQAKGYRTETFDLKLGEKNDHTVKMVIKRQDVFVSNRSGKYDVYKVDLDGKNEKVILAGSGLERNDIVLVQHPTDDIAVVVSSRVNIRNRDGYIMDSLTLINTADNSTKAVAQSEQIHVVGWIGNRLLYMQVAAGASAANPNRFQLISYDYKTSDKKQLASANDFNDVLLDGRYVYYSPSSAFQKDPAAGLIRSAADGSEKQTLLKEEVWNIFRTDYKTLDLVTKDSAYQYKIGDKEDPIKLSQKPTNPDNRLYITSPDGKHSLWVDQRDGKGLLIDYDIDKQADKTLETKGGISYPVKWLSDTVLIYRVHTDQETTDYVLDISGGKSHKVTSLYNAAGIDRWYYY